MKKISEILKNARVRRDYSVRQLAQITKIKTSFISAIEEERWEDLPPFPTVLGFVKSIAGALGVDAGMAVAVLKRDYPPKKLSINPKPDVSSKFTWSPKLTFLLGIFVVAIVVFGYLIFQYLKFVSPPSLNVESPKENQVVTEGSVLVFGTTDLDAKITANNQPILVDERGKFSASIGVSKATTEVDIAATSRSGKTTVVSRKIEVQ